jgi:hypothetical protein
VVGGSVEAAKDAGFERMVLKRYQYRREWQFKTIDVSTRNNIGVAIYKL